MTDLGEKSGSGSESGESILKSDPPRDLERPTGVPTPTSRRPTPTSRLGRSSPPITTPRPARAHCSTRPARLLTAARVLAQRQTTPVASAFQRATSADVPFAITYPARGRPSMTLVAESAKGTRSA